MRLGGSSVVVAGDFGGQSRHGLEAPVQSWPKTPEAEVGTTWRLQWPEMVSSSSERMDFDRRAYWVPKARPSFSHEVFVSCVFRL